ncbi:MAG: NAD(+) synthase [Bacteroidales bacterium]|nr:NAD(+) synthase [Bacteroidales bacterium]
MKALKVAAATPKVKVADVDWNVTEIVRLSKEIAANSDPGLIVFPELAVTGYTCGDLFLQKALISKAESGVRRLLSETAGLTQTLVVGCPVASEGKLLDAALVIRGGKIIGTAAKTSISPEESRWFQAGESSQAFNVGEFTFSVIVGDDLKTTSESVLTIRLAASFEIAGKHDRRKALLQALPGCNVFCCNGYGESTDDYVWAGSSLIYQNGVMLAENKRFQSTSSWISAEFNLERQPSAEPSLPEDANREIFDIQVTALMSRLEHIHCSKCVIGVSGGLDSTLALLVICEAFDRLGYDRKGIYGVTMPCFGTSDRTKSNAWILMEKLGITAMEIGIGDAVTQHFKDIGQDPSNHDVTFENAQARERTQVLMDLSNKVGGIVVGTGDLSEIALGWCTYNGDHMSMYGVNSGVPKTLIRAIVRMLAKGHPCEAALLDILDTPVSPELLPGSQPTEGIIGPYELHDFFLLHVCHGESPKVILSAASLVFAGTYDKETVRKWFKIFLKRFFSQQFKRSCSPCGPKVMDISLSPRAWLMPTDASASLWLEELD